MKTLITTLALSLAASSAFALTTGSRFNSDDTPLWEFGKDIGYGHSVMYITDNDCSNVIGVCNDITIDYKNNINEGGEPTYYNSGRLENMITQDFKVAVHAQDGTNGDAGGIASADLVQFHLGGIIEMDPRVLREWWARDPETVMPVHETGYTRYRHYVDLGKPIKEEPAPVPLPLPILMLGTSILGLTAYKKLKS